MNIFLNQVSHIRKIVLTLLLSFSLLSCGSGGVVSAGISGTGIVFGTITGYGSIFVNGVEYEIEGASFELDGQTGTIVNNGDLKLGMVVKLDNVTDNGDGTGTATNVVYQDALEGPVTTVPDIPASGDTNLKEFEILGLTVIINATTTVYDGEAGFGFNTIALNDLIEVSGFIGPDGDIIASRVEKTGDLDTTSENDGDVEIHGVISQITSSTEFLINGITVSVDNNTILDGLDSLAVGILVEVEGKYIESDGSINADIIESENDDLDDITSSTGEVSLQGVITDYVSNSDFRINGIGIDATSFTGTLENGLEVEVEGEFSNDILIADELEIRSGQAEFTALISSVANIAASSITVGYPAVTGDITLNFDSQSRLVDETDTFSDPLTLQDLSVDMTVKVEVISDGADWLVTTLKVVDDTEEFEIEGVVTVKSLIDLTLTINGLILEMDPNSGTEYEVGNTAVSASDFFLAITEGSTYVELEDKDRDGLFDSAEVD